MIVVTNRIPVATGHEIDFEDRFRNRVHLVDTSPGFIPETFRKDQAIATA